MSDNRRLVIAVSLMLSCCYLWAQQSTGILHRFDLRFQQLDTLIFREADSAHSTLSHALGLSRSVAYDSIYEQAVRERTERQQSVLQAETGLQLSGQLYARLDNVLDWDDDDPVSVYRAKAQAELRWYFLQSSLYKRGGRERELQLKGEIDILAHEKERIDLTIYRQKEMLRWRSDSLLAGVLAHRVQNLALLQEANLYLLENENISSDELLRIIDERAQAERQLTTLSGVFPQAQTLAHVDAWVVDVDSARLMQHIENTQIDLRLLQLRLSLLDQRAENESWWRTVRVAPFVRYSGYYTAANTYSNNFDAGISFTVPINRQTDRSRKAILAEKEVSEAQWLDVKQQVSDKVSYLLQEIGRLNRASMAEVARMNELRSYLTMRNNAYDNRAGEYSRLMRMKEYNSYISAVEKLIDFQYRRDNCIADLQAFLADGSIIEYCKPSPL